MPLMCLGFAPIQPGPHFYMANEQKYKRETTRLAEFRIRNQRIRIWIHTFFWIRIRIQTVADYGSNPDLRLYLDQGFMTKDFGTTWACPDPDSNSDPLTNLNPNQIRIRNTARFLQFKLLYCSMQPSSSWETGHYYLPPARSASLLTSYTVKKS